MPAAVCGNAGPGGLALLRSCREDMLFARCRGPDLRQARCRAVSVYSAKTFTDQVTKCRVLLLCDPPVTAIPAGSAAQQQSDTDLLPVSSMIKAAKLCQYTKLPHMGAERLPVAMETVAIRGHSRRVGTGVGL